MTTHTTTTAIVEAAIAKRTERNLVAAQRVVRAMAIGCADPAVHRRLVKHARRSDGRRADGVDAPEASVSRASGAAHAQRAREIADRMDGDLHAARRQRRELAGLQRDVASAAQSVRYLENFVRNKARSSAKARKAARCELHHARRELARAVRALRAATR